MCSLKDTTKGLTFFKLLKQLSTNLTVLRSALILVTDGANAMVGNKSGLAGLLKENEINCPVSFRFDQAEFCGNLLKKKQCNKNCCKTH